MPQLQSMGGQHLILNDDLLCKNSVHKTTPVIGPFNKSSKRNLGTTSSSITSIGGGESAICSYF